MRPFQFMIGTRGIAEPRVLVEMARKAESIGYSHLTIHDHLTPQLAPIPVLTAVAMATERLRLCPLVLNNDLRHPAVLAQDLATLDLISEGRVVVGLGAGWNEPEYTAAGIVFDPPPASSSTRPAYGSNGCWRPSRCCAGCSERVHSPLPGGITRSRRWTDSQGRSNSRIHRF